MAVFAQKRLDKRRKIRHFPYMKVKKFGAIIKLFNGSGDLREGECDMFQRGDRVVYGIHGVCDVIDTEKQMVDRKQVIYLVLEPVGQPGARFLVPTHNAAAMGKLKKMLSRDEMEAMLLSDAVRVDCWIADEGRRKQTYRELISSGDREKLMAMVHTLYVHKARQAEAGRKVHLCDDNFLRDAEKLLMGEAAIVMGMEPEQAKRYIKSSLKE